MTLSTVSVADTVTGEYNAVTVIGLAGEWRCHILFNGVLMAQLTIEVLCGSGTVRVSDRMASPCRVEPTGYAPGTQGLADRSTTCAWRVHILQGDRG